MIASTATLTAQMPTNQQSLLASRLAAGTSMIVGFIADFSAEYPVGITCVREHDRN